MSDVQAQTQTSPSQEIATSESWRNKPLGVQLKEREGQFLAALPTQIPVERFIRVILTAIQNNPDLRKADRDSLWNACMKAAADGLLPDNREGALVIYGKLVQWQPMVAGILKKVRNSGQLSSIVARVVYGGDKYRNWIDDEGEHIEYEAAEAQDRSNVRLVFAMAKLKDGAIEVEPLTPADVEKIRAVSRAKNNGPWVSWWEEMAKKSAIKRLAKRLPISTDLDDLMRRDDAYAYDLDKEAEKRGPSQKATISDRLGALANGETNGEAKSDPPHDPETGEIIEHEQDRPADSAATEPAGGVSAPAEAASQEPLGAALVPPAGAAPSDPEADRAARKAEILATGDARAAAGTAALRNFLEELRADGEDGLITAVRKSAWSDVAKAADAKAGRKA